MSDGLEARSHSGLGALLGQHFIAPGRVDPSVAKGLSRLQQFRGEADYNRFFSFTESSAQEELQVAADLCGSVTTWLTAAGWAIE